MHPIAQKFIDNLQLEAHPEGGYFRRTYQNNILLPDAILPHNFEGNRLAASAIYFLLTSNSFSAFHRLQADELWHFYAGSVVTLYLIHPDGRLETLQLGNFLTHKTASFQVLIPAQTWFAAAVNTPDSYALVGCTLSPAFDFSDFELANKTGLLKEYPQHFEMIERLCKE
ncbi:MAG: cupin domain-containing protein [Chitinophagales bacterium]